MSLHTWLRRLRAIYAQHRPATFTPRAARRRYRAVRTTPQFEPLEARVLLANAVQFDVSSVLNTHTIVGYGPGGIVVAPDSLDGGIWSLMTQSAADQRAPAGSVGLPDSGFFAANAFHPDVQLNYNTLNSNLPDVRRQAFGDTSGFQFAVPSLAYEQLHFFITSGSGSDTFAVQANYADGSADTSPVFGVPDWYSTIGESSSAYYLATGMERITTNGCTYDGDHPNHFSVFGFEYDPDPTKILQSITIQPLSVPGTFVFFGATGVTDTTYLSSKDQTIAAAEGQVAGGTLGSFTAVNTNAQAGDFTATISWGDGQVTTGTITDNGGGQFVVGGSHVYTEAGSEPINVVINELATNHTLTIQSTANVADVPLSATPVPVTATEGIAFSSVVASFTDANLDGTAGDFTALISWGDGHSSLGTVTATGPGSYQVTGSNTYAEEGSYGVSVTITDVGGSMASASSTNIVADAPLTANATPVATTEGSAFTGVVASFSDADLKGTASDFTATITWGDGHSSSGTVAMNGPGSFQIVGSNTYAKQGTYAISVAISDVGGSTTTIGGTVTIADAPLGATGILVAVTEGATFTGAVASFTDDNPVGQAGDFTALITWGDGQTSAGTVTADGQGGFQVTGSNTYAQAGSYTVLVAITDVGGAAAAASSTATVFDAPLSVSAAPLTATEGIAFTGTVASFTDANPLSTAGDFTATITWGDGHTSAGTVTKIGAGTFQAAGSNTYAEEGGYPVSVVITDVGGNTASASSTATVADGALSASAVSVTATEGTAFTGTVASFSDADLKGTASDFTATITWGNGHSSSGTVTKIGAGSFQISGSNTYSQEGGYAIHVTITDVGGSTTSTSGTVTVADAPLNAAAVTVAATEGLVFTGVVASFTDPNLAGTTSDFTATISWGDGHSSSGTVTTNGAGSFQVTGSNTYAEEGSYAVSVTINDVGGSRASASSTVTVADAALSASAAPVAATEGTAFTGVVATFTDANPSDTASDFTATITWGDGHTSAGIVTATGPRSFQVTGSNTYAEEGGYTVSVIISDVGGSTASASSTATVADGALSASAILVTATEGATFTGVVASFTDADRSGTASDFTATITWGDGHTSSGTVTMNGPGSFQIIGSNTYAEEDGYTVSVTINDVGGSTASISGNATVVDAALTASAASVATTEGSVFTGAVASFTDANPGSAAGEFTATITWGDGRSSTGTVTATGSGSFQVTGSHRYTEEGSYTISVTVTDTGGSTASTSGTATVADAALSVTPVTVAATEGTAFTGAVASFTDANPNSLASDFTATITWGDGHTSAGTIMAAGSSGFQVIGSNTYADEGSYVLSVTINDIGGSTASLSGTALVADAPLTAAGVSATATSGTTFNGVVATFTDADPNGTAAQYTAVITWGDGTSSTGTIAFDSTQQAFTVAGSHTYTTSGSQAVTVTIQDQGTQVVAAGEIVVTSPAPPPVSPPPPTLVGNDFSAVAGVKTSRIVVATFADSASAQQWQNYHARIDWGDSSSSSKGTIVQNADGTFSVVGQHTYDRAGKYTVRVLVTRPNAGPLSATCTATVANSPPVVAVTSVQNSASHTVQLTVAYADTTRQKHTLRINWGDGTESTLDLGTQRYGLTCVAHGYKKDTVSTQITVTVADDDGSVSTPATFTAPFKTKNTHVPVRESVGWDAYYAAIATQLADFYHDDCD